MIEKYKISTEEGGYGGGGGGILKFWTRKVRRTTNSSYPTEINDIILNCGKCWTILREVNVVLQGLPYTLYNLEPPPIQNLDNYLEIAWAHSVD